MLCWEIMVIYYRNHVEYRTVLWAKCRVFYFKPGNACAMHCAVYTNFVNGGLTYAINNYIPLLYFDVLRCFLYLVAIKITFYIFFSDRTVSGCPFVAPTPDIVLIFIFLLMFWLCGHPSISTSCSGDMKWWSKPIGVDDKKNPWYELPNSVAVEMTAYGLLIYLQRGLVQDALPIMKWLISQRNEQGGFASTQVITLHGCHSRRNLQI